MLRLNISFIVSVCDGRLDSNTTNVKVKRHLRVFTASTNLIQIQPMLRLNHNVKQKNNPYHNIQIQPMLRLN